MSATREKAGLLIWARTSSSRSSGATRKSPLTDCPAAPRERSRRRMIPEEMEVEGSTSKPAATCQVRLPGGAAYRPLLALRARQGVVAVDDGCIERRHDRRVQEVQQVRRRRAQSLDPGLIEPADGLDEGCLGGGAKTRIKKAAGGRQVL